MEDPDNITPELRKYLQTKKERELLDRNVRSACDMVHHFKRAFEGAVIDKNLQMIDWFLERIQFYNEQLKIALDKRIEFDQ